MEKLVFETWTVQLDFFSISTKSRQFLSAETTKNRIAPSIIALISRWPRTLLHCGAGNGAGSMQEMAEMGYKQQAGLDPFLVLGGGFSRAGEVRKGILCFRADASSLHYMVWRCKTMLILPHLCLTRFLPFILI